MENPIDVVSDEVFTIKLSSSSSVPSDEPVVLKQNEKTQSDITDRTSQEPIKYKTYKRRWLVLFLFVFYSASNSSQWIQYSIIANVVSKYYSVPTVWVDWTSMIYMVSYIPLIFPASYLIEVKVSDSFN